MGDHVKLIPKETTIGDGITAFEVVLKNGDLLIKCIPEKEGIFFPEFSKEVPACLIKIFKVEDFNEKFMTAWQTGEGIYSEGFLRIWGYDEVEFLEKTLESIHRNLDKDSITKNKITYMVIKQEELSKK